MNHTILIRSGLVGLSAVTFVLLSAAVKSDTVYFAGTAPVPNIAQVPLYMKDAVPPLNMLVMGKDHKIYYEAYNDASDLDGDGVLDVGYKPDTIDYYGYFNSNVCYTYETSGRFIPSSEATDKQCSGKWSGDFLNYLTTSRMDALRRVLYGGWRQVDTASDTTLQGAFFPQDAHSWGKEYQSVARDGYDISKYAPLYAPTPGKYHLFAVTTVTGNNNTFASGYAAPLFRVMQNSTARVWEWVSIEGPVAGNKCYNQNTDCLTGTNDWSVVPAAAFENLSITTWKRTSGSGSPDSLAGMDRLFTDNAVEANRCGNAARSTIDATGTSINPFVPGANSCGHDNYLTMFSGSIVIPSDGNYQFAIDGDDAVDLRIGNTDVVGWYGGHANDRSNGGLNSHSGSIYLAAGTYTVRFRHQEAGGGEAWGLFWKPVSGANVRNDYNVRVQVCPTDASLRDDTCKVYPNGNAKPTGILHDYGESQKMYFGLITGSQFNNLQGGVLRRNISDFADEINTDDGTFKPGTGIANALSKLRMIGGGYDGSVTNNLNNNKNWNWANGTGNCPSIGNRAIENGECRMWGNPIAEMMFEGMRYFAGAKSPTGSFATGGASQGVTEETTMGLSQEDWKDPYAEGGYPACAKPYQTVISDINPSYDGNLPGSAFASVSPDSAVSGFDAAAQGNAIWGNEFGGPRNVFIGDVAGVSDGAPTAKTAASFGNIRGLAPEEPTKEGTYYAASVARYGYLNDLNAADGDQKLGVYSIALASPLPRIEFPVNGKTVTLLPFAKTVSGTFGESARKPTNTIVDFYVEKIVNLPGGQFDATVNGGRPSAVFRINYEDVEQGNDHDMDAIVKYTIEATKDNKVKVSLKSEYAAGSANQNIGYVISGTTEDGIYLEVRDTDSAQGSSVYEFNTPTTPSTVWAGGCINATGSSPCNVGLTFDSSRTFSTGSASTGIQLENPLWYAAKYGGFKDTNGNNMPDAGEWDTNRSGEPDNYFLVTNPLQLRTQLTKAFDNIANRDLDVGVATISGARVGNSSFTLQPTFNRGRNGKDWTGNLSAIAVNPDGTLGDSLWNAQANLPGAGARKIWTLDDAGTAMEFNSTNITDVGVLGINNATVSTVYGAAYSAADFVNYLRGDQSREASVGGTGNTLRERSKVLGDIVNSEPVIVSPRSNYGYGYYGDAMFDGYVGTTGYLEAKKTRKTVAFVGANDGMLHAFDASTEPCADGIKTCAKSGAGKELFGFVPNNVLGRLGELALPDNAYPGSTRSFDHHYYVDGQITVGDAKDGGTWKTVLVGSTGAGGRSVFALDVSDADSFGGNDVLWELNSSADHDIGHVYGKPMLVPLENGEWGVLFGNGYGGNTSDPSLYIVDAFSGNVIKKITADDGHQASEVTGVSGWICSATGIFCAKNEDPYNGLGQITAIDKDGNGKIDTVYGGDLQGNLWKFDLSGSSKSAWDVANSGTPLFTADTGSERQPITGAIRVAAGPGSGVMVYFGTGRYFVTGDNDVLDSPQVQSFYAVFDNFTSAAGGRANLVKQTITAEVEKVDNNGTPGDPTDDTTYLSRNISKIPVNYYGTNPARGWYLDLKVADSNAAGERFIATPLIQSGRVFFTTYQPSENSCDPGGINFQYGLDLLSGGGTLSNVTVLPSGTPACTDGNCGGVAIGGKDAVAQPPVMGTGIAAINPLTQIDDTCDPSTESCATFEQCQVVIYPGGFVLPRPCGRQSWRQLK